MKERKEKVIEWCGIYWWIIDLRLKIRLNKINSTCVF